MDGSMNWKLWAIALSLCLDPAGSFIHSFLVYKIWSRVHAMMPCHNWRLLGASCLKSNGRKRARSKKQEAIQLHVPYHTLYCSCMNVSRVLYFFGWNYSTDGMTWHGMGWHDWIESCERLHFDFQTTDWLCVMWCGGLRIIVRLNQSKEWVQSTVM